MSDEPSTGVKFSSECTNRYELIMVAAREARRLNDFYRIRNVEPKSRVTSEAIRRARGGGVRFAYGDPAPLLGETDAEESSAAGDAGAPPSTAPADDTPADDTDAGE